jgi:hypothetical protein
MNLGEGTTLVAIARSAEEPTDGNGGATPAAPETSTPEMSSNGQQPPEQTQ